MQWCIRAAIDHYYAVKRIKVLWLWLCVCVHTLEKICKWIDTGKWLIVVKRRKNACANLLSHTHTIVITASHAARTHWMPLFTSISFWPQVLLRLPMLMMMMMNLPTVHFRSRSRSFSQFFSSPSLPLFNLLCVCPHSFFFSSSSSSTYNLSHTHTQTHKLAATRSIASLSLMHRTYSYLMNSIAIIIIITIIIIRVNTLLLRCNLLGCLCCRLVVKRTSLRTVLCVVIHLFLFLFLLFIFFEFVSLYTLYYIPFQFILFVTTISFGICYFSRILMLWNAELEKIGFIKLSFVFSVFCLFFAITFHFLIVNRIGCFSWFDFPNTKKSVRTFLFNWRKQVLDCLYVCLFVCFMTYAFDCWVVFGQKIKGSPYQDQSFLKYVQWEWSYERW